MTSLDRGVAYTLFNVRVKDKFPAMKVPFRMNGSEEYFVVGQTLHLRYNLAQILYAHGLRNKEERLVRMEKICYQLNGGTTALHDFALNLPTLTKILQQYEEQDKRCLCHVLLPNELGKTPLDLAIEHDLVKNIEVMLLKLSLLPNFRLSKLLYKKFPIFFKKDMRAFYKYLDTCFFKTVQMKSNNKLHLNSSDDPYIIAHNSSLIDREFRLKYTQNTPPKHGPNALTTSQHGGAILVLDEQSTTRLNDPFSMSMFQPVPVEEEVPLQEREKERLVEIKSIEFDWVFATQYADQFMTSIAESQNMELFQLLIIKTVILFQWQFFRKVIIL